ncbi:unnamed protein product, partial [Sphacelaria rigidula]
GKPSRSGLSHHFGGPFRRRYGYPTHRLHEYRRVIDRDSECLREMHILQQVYATAVTPETGYVYPQRLSGCLRDYLWGQLLVSHNYGRQDDKNVATAEPCIFTSARMRQSMNRSAKSIRCRSQIMD